jgi:eukaryotic-like serine/threonine-protein kinase
LSGAEATPRADVYALGAVLYYLLAGKAALEADTPHALAMLHLDREPPRPSERLGRPIPRPIEDVTMRCLSKDPSERFENGDALAAALHAIGA